MRERSVIEANEEDINKKETNAQKINILLTNSLLPQPYTKEIAKHGSNCTICLDDFNSNDKVCVTSCLHDFHYKCLSSWLHKKRNECEVSDLQFHFDKRNRGAER